jgi:hypothetical protein
MLRGVVEGYYGRPWSGDARRAVIRHCARQGLRAFVYGPKNDPWHRDRWREPYPADALADLAATARVAHAVGTRFVWAVSPGLDMRWADADDRRALEAKLAQLVAAGVRDVALFVDDVPEALGDADAAAFGGADGPAVARAHADVANAVDAWLRARGLDGLAFVVPTDYAGVAESPYLAELGARLGRGLPIGWTGPAVLCPTIGADQARARRRATGGHPVVLWDNYPVNDVVLSNSLHLGPLTGRDPSLPAELAGHLFNPMTQPFASLVALDTAAAWCRDPAGYDAEAAWHAALRAHDPGGDLAVLAAQVRSSVLTAPDWEDATALAAAHAALAAAWTATGWPAALDALDAEYARQAAAAARLAARAATPLGAEIAPWVAEMGAHAARGREAVTLLRALRPDLRGLRADRDAVTGRLVGPDAGVRARLAPGFAPGAPAPDLGAYLAGLGALLGPDIGCRPELGLNVHGKALYLLPRGLTDVELVTGRNVHHRVLDLVRGALDDPPARGPFTLRVDGAPHAVDADGGFRVRRPDGGPLVLAVCDDARVLGAWRVA